MDEMPTRPEQVITRLMYSTRRKLKEHASLINIEKVLECSVVILNGLKVVFPVAHEQYNRTNPTLNLPGCKNQARENGARHRTVSFG